MVGIVVVSHSQKLAEGVVELAKLMAGDANIDRLVPALKRLCQQLKRFMWRMV